MPEPFPKFIPIKVPPRELILAVANMSIFEARKLIGMYWRLQKARIGTDLSLDGIDNPGHIYMARSIRRIETQIRRAMDAFVDQHTAGRWASQVDGIGPVIGASLVAYVDVLICGDNVNKLFRYAGLDPSAIWVTHGDLNIAFEEVKNKYGPVLSPDHIQFICNKFRKNIKLVIGHAKSYGDGTLNWESFRRALVIRPHNPALKLICHYIGEQFMLRSNEKPDSLYSQIYRNHFEFNDKKNDEGGFAEEAKKIFGSKRWKRFDESSPAYWLERGFLPKIHIKMRSRRYTTKIFLTHYHQVAYYDMFHKLPRKPWILEKMGGAEYVCPNWPFKILPPGEL